MRRMTEHGDKSLGIPAKHRALFLGEGSAVVGVAGLSVISDNHDTFLRSGNVSLYAFSEGL